MKNIRVEDRYVYCVLHADDLYTTRNTHTHAHTSIASYDSEEEQAKIVQYSTVQYSTVQYITLQYSTAQYSTQLTKTDSNELKCMQFMHPIHSSALLPVMRAKGVPYCLYQ